MTEWYLAIGSAFWFGILTSISPCPLATNIAAISFAGRKVGSVPQVLGAGLLYTLGRTLTYTILGILLVHGLMATPELSHLLQKYMNLLMGPLLILVAMILLKLLTIPAVSGGIGERMRKKVEKMGVCGAGLLGIVFALSFWSDFGGIVLRKSAAVGTSTEIRNASADDLRDCDRSSGAVFRFSVGFLRQQNRSSIWQTVSV